MKLKTTNELNFNEIVQICKKNAQKYLSISNCYAINKAVNQIV